MGEAENFSQRYKSFVKNSFAVFDKRLSAVEIAVTK